VDVVERDDLRRDAGPVNAERFVSDRAVPDKMPAHPIETVDNFDLPGARVFFFK
jgi:hypothetical protein